MAKIMRLVEWACDAEGLKVGRVHCDGSITFRGQRYADLGQVPAECVGLRPDLETHRQWRALYSAIDPRRRRRKNRGIAPV